MVMVIIIVIVVVVVVVVDDDDVKNKNMNKNNNSNNNPRKGSLPDRAETTLGSFLRPLLSSFIRPAGARGDSLVPNCTNKSIVS